MSNPKIVDEITCITEFSPEALQTATVAPNFTLASDEEKSAIGISMIPVASRVRTVEDKFQNELGKSSSATRATAEQLAMLRHVPDAIPLASWIIVVVELCERFSYHGIAGPFQNYIQHAPGGPAPGYLGLGQQVATGLSQFFMFWCYITPIFGAIVADQYIGRYKSILVFCIFMVIGEVILVGSSIPQSTFRFGGLLIAMIVIGLGVGGVKANVGPMMADQYPTRFPFVRTIEKTREQIIVDPNLSIERMFMYFYFAINIGGLAPIITTTLEHKIDFWAAFLAPLSIGITGFCIVIALRNMFIRRPPTGSVLSYAFRVLYLSIRGGFNMNAAKPSLNPRLEDCGWDDLFVCELRKSLKACRVFCFYPMFWACYFQMLTNLISQAATMKTDGVPNDLIVNVNPVTIIICIPLFDLVIYPTLRKWRIRCLPISKMTCGFGFAAASMLYAAIVQALIYSSPPFGNRVGEMKGKNDIIVWIQVPAYFLLAISEILASITGFEYAYTKAPSSMKSLVMASFLLTTALGALLSMAISPLARDPYLVWMYGGVSIATVVVTIIMWVCLRGLNRFEDDIGETEREEVRRAPVLEVQ